MSPRRWTLRGSQYGMLKTWRVARDGTYVDGVKISPVSLKDLDIPNHHSIRLRIGVKENAKYPGGVNIFGRGFGNYDQDIVLRIHTAEWPSNAGPPLDNDRKIAGILSNGG